jgi:hypothetical protein
MQTILYLAFGNQSFFDEALFSILSLKNVAPDASWRIVVYTDKPDCFARTPGVETVLIPMEKVRQWIASFGYFYRVKIQALRDCMDRYGGTVTMLDGDTLFTANPALTLAKIAPDVALMNQPDPGRRCIPACRRLIDASQDLWDELAIPDAPRNWRTWNSGVIGLHTAHRPLLDQILYLNDALYVRSGIRTVEQIAASVILQNHVRLEAMDKEMEHYFWAKLGFAPRLKVFMDENRDKPHDELAKLAADFRPGFVRDPAPLGKRKWKRSYAKRADALRFRMAKFLHGSEWMRDLEESRKQAILH